MEEFKLVKNCWNDDALRKSFNKLAEKTFGIDFEDWYQNGFWSENYIPYSIIYKDRVVANVSVNQMYFSEEGEKKYFLQIGTVMTEERFRNKGLIRRLMQEIEKDFGTRTEEMYLFANNEVLDFYPKFGYREETEYQYEREVCLSGEQTARRVSMKEKADWDKLEQAIRKSAVQGRFEMINNSQLVMFYLTKFMQDDVYYIKELDAYAIAELEDGNLLLHAVYAKKAVDLYKVIQAFGKEVKKVLLGFTPKDAEGYRISELKMDDTTLFVKGKELVELSKHGIMFPTLSHA